MEEERRPEYPQQPKPRKGLGRLNPLGGLPEETRIHSRNAMREQLLALRSLLDRMIRRLE